MLYKAAQRNFFAARQKRKCKIIIFLTGKLYQFLYTKIINKTGILQLIFCICKEKSIILQLIFCLCKENK